MDWSRYFESEEEQAAMAVRILGDASAAKGALDDLKRRRDEGQDAVIWKDAGRWFVGPRPPAGVLGPNSLIPQLYKVAAR